MMMEMFLDEQKARKYNINIDASGSSLLSYQDMG